MKPGYQLNLSDYRVRPLTTLLWWKMDKPRSSTQESCHLSRNGCVKEVIGSTTLEQGWTKFSCKGLDLRLCQTYGLCGNHSTGCYSLNAARPCQNQWVWLCSSKTLYMETDGGLDLVEDHSLVPEKAMAPHSTTLAWKIPWTEGLVGCSPRGR